MSRGVQSQEQRKAHSAVLYPSDNEEMLSSSNKTSNFAAMTLTGPKTDPDESFSRRICKKLDLKSQQFSFPVRLTFILLAVTTENDAQAFLRRLNRKDRVEPEPLCFTH